MVEVYQLPQGKITIGFSDEQLSIGLLSLRPGKSLEKHNRPVAEQLLQVRGSCVMQLFDGGSVKDIELKEGDTLTIPANRFHIHSSPSEDESITLWKFEGDILSVLEKIRAQFKRIL
ncbi:MAG TPA: hypothetical protein VJB16_04610 [archaeon]|nr:hypothetical protein [archaeon]